MLYSLVRPLLFALDAEKAHGLSLTFNDYVSVVRPSVTFDDSPVRVMGIDFPNRVGLAAGLDKNAEHIAALGTLGFGFLEVGTVTPKPQDGNPKPRLFRLVSSGAIINRMGFNNKGVDNLVDNVEKQRCSFAGVVGVNIGKNKDTPNDRALDDYIHCLRKVYACADYVVINISSPNTAGLRDLQHTEALKHLFNGLKSEQKRLAQEYGYTPIAIKIAPDLSDDALREVAELILEYDIDAVIATNTTIDKQAVQHELHGMEEGGLSGNPVKDQSTHVIRVLNSVFSGAVPIIGVGGIASEADAQEKIAAGASLVQVYSGLIYQGPRLVRRLVESLS